jgi:hypothetical protein
VRHHQPDEPDRARERDHAAGEQRGGEEHPALEAPGVHSELHGRLLAQRQEIELARAVEHQPEAAERQDGEQRQRGGRDRCHVPEQPVHHTAQPVEVDDRDQHGDGRGEEDADDDPREQQGLDRQPTRHRGDRVDGGRRADGAREREHRHAQRLQRREPEPEDLRQHDAEGRAARDTEHRRLGQRVTRQPLKGDACHRQRPTRQHGGRHARQPQLQGDDRLDRRRSGPTRQGAHHVAGGEPSAADEERDDDHHHERRAEHRECHDQPTRRAHRNASGWIIRASISSPSGTRGP